MNDKGSSSNIDRALTLLEEISNHPDGISLAELSNVTKLAKTTTFRILETLRLREYISFDNITERYLLDIKSLELGTKGLMNANLVEVAIPYLKTLSCNTNETCFLGVYNAGHVIYLYKSEGTMSIQTNARLGSRMPAYCTGIGKALLAHQSLDEIDRVLNGPLAKVTDKTVTDKTKLYNLLADIRLKGYSLDDEENEEGLTCVGQPLFNYTGKIVGAVSVAGPSHRMVPKLNSVIDNLSDITHTISRRLGFVGHSL